MLRTRLLALALLSSLVAASLPSAGEPTPPGEGQLLIDNQLVQGQDGSCSGTIRMVYGMAPSNQVQLWGAQIGEYCDITVTRAFEEDVPSFYAPAGPVYIKPGLHVRYFSTSWGWQTDSVNMSGQFWYGVGFPAPCHPGFEGVQTTYRTGGWGWSSNPPQDGTFTNCGTYVFQEHGHSRARGYTHALARHYEATCEWTAIFVESGGNRGGTTCYLGNADPGDIPFGPEEVIAHLVPRESKIVDTTA